MKILFRIVIILAVGALVAGAAYLILNDSSSTSVDGGTRPAFDGTAPTFDGPPPDFSAGDRPTRPDGDLGGESALFGRGFSGILDNLIKISGITAVVLALQFAISFLRKRRAAVPVKA